MREFFQPPKPDDLGWITAAFLAMLLIAKYGPVWVRALRESRSLETANLITGLQRQIDSLNDTVTQKEKTIQNLVDRCKHLEAQEQERKREVDALRRDYRQLKEFYEG